jgi:FkbM family methyltransferase
MPQFSRLTRRNRLRLANLNRFREVFVCMLETAQWLPLTLAYVGLLPLRYPFEVRLRSGEVLILREQTDLVIFWMIFVRRYYPVNQSDRVIVDVGANIGLFTLYAARKAPGAQIFSIEPFPETCQFLINLVKANHLTHRVTVLNCAIAGFSGIQAMDAAPGIPSQYRRIYSPATRAVNREHRGQAGLRQTAAGIPVRTETLVHVMDIAQIASADLIKLNIHGSEYEVLMFSPPAALRHFRRIAVQYHELPAEAHVGKKQLFEHLNRTGFRLVSDEDTQRGSGLAVFAA